ncbi:MAG: UDP-glucose 6-dehydrogenase [Candidatus Marinimicrobia bacterium]|nr:UDP-glucose 6-dehydrogenase [Candidatus Neomarinimicrobiota bacterium]|tara:strand:- start:8743 stop:10038 length:1296 start_codon:yes stop_codon:yes gene_type:complete
MKLVIVGTGYVGLVSGACFSEFGYETVCVDKDANRIEELKSGKCPFYEPGMDELLSKHLKNTKLLSFSHSLSESMKNADIVFITVGTPSRRLEDDTDLSFVWSVAEEISQNINKYSIIVTKSTVPVGTSKQIKNIIQKKVSKENFDIISNPEFLREGSAINDFMRPDRVIIGTENSKSEKIMRELYRPLFLRETPIVSTSIETAEIIKYASNSFLATKIGFINEVADLCEAVGANVQEVSKAMGIDQRIGSKFLNAGPGYGGSCFPKDVKAFTSTASKYDVNLSIVKAVHESNQKRIMNISNKILNNIEKNSVLSFLGLSFKPNTDDIRESTSINIANNLFKKGFTINCFDPVAMDNSKKEFTNFNYFNSANEACENADAIVIGTEWNEFRALNFREIGKIVKTKKIFDLRNIYNKIELQKLGYDYYGTGK